MSTLLVNWTMDKVSREARSRMMSLIRAKGNRSTERRFRASMARQGIRGWLVTPKGIRGNPDFVFPRQRVAIFIDGCFWHGCDRCCQMPQSRRSYWCKKIQGNVRRDRLTRRRLKREGWKILHFWEHDLRDRLGWCMGALNRKLTSL